jgi:trk system potassium uptake protein
MKIIVAGCGRVGATLATKLSLEGHEVAVVDKDPDAFNRLRKSFTGKTYKGMVFDGDALKKAGIENADAFVSVTSGDNSNVVSATIAKDIFKVPKVIARIYEPRRAEIYRRFGIPTVSAVTWATNEIHALLTQAEVIRDATLGNGDVQIIRKEVPPRMIGHTVAELVVPGEIMVIAIIRGGQAMLANESVVFQERDQAEIAVLTTALPKVRQMMAP